MDPLSPVPSKSLWFVFGLPIALALAILVVSPNFKMLDGVRSGSLGGDYLQEWVGGSIVGSEERDRLYDASYYQSVQHDASVVGFEWDAGDYFPMVYPPFYYWANVPLANLNYPTAMKIWTLISALAISLGALLLYWFYPPCRRILGVGVVVALVFVPLLNSLNMGQKSTFLLLIFSGTFLLLHHRRPFSAGLLFGLIAFKPHLGIVIGLVMLAKQQWRFALGSLLMVEVLVGSSWVVHPQLWNDYLVVVMQMGDYVQSIGYQLEDSHSLWGAMQMTFSWLPPVAVKFIAGALAIVVIVLLSRIMKGRVDTASTRFSLQYSAMVIATVMLSPHFYTYDLTILLLPMLLIASSYPPGRWRENRIDRSLGFVLMGVFALAGAFAMVARVVGIQPSVILLMTLLVLIGESNSLRDSQGQITEA